MITQVVWAASALALHAIGVQNQWYESQGGYWWFDHVTHFVSGGALFYILLTLFDWPWAIAGFVVANILWEAFEYLHGNPKELWIGYRNMVYDVVFGCFAASLVWIIT